MTEDKRQKIKAEQALQVAKTIQRKTIVVPRGITGDLLTGKNQMPNNKNPKTKGINHDDVLKMLKDGVKHSEVAKKFKVSTQSISYIKNKYKEI